MIPFIVRIIRNGFETNELDDSITKVMHLYNTRKSTFVS